MSSYMQWIKGYEIFQSSKIGQILCVKRYVPSATIIICIISFLLPVFHGSYKLLHQEFWFSVVERTSDKKQVPFWAILTQHCARAHFYPIPSVDGWLNCSGVRKFIIGWSLWTKKFLDLKILMHQQQSCFNNQTTNTFWWGLGHRGRLLQQCDKRSSLLRGIAHDHNLGFADISIDLLLYPSDS